MLVIADLVNLTYTAFSHTVKIMGRIEIDYIHQIVETIAIDQLLEVSFGWLPKLYRAEI